MFDLYFGLVWIFMTAIFTFMMYGNTGVTIIVDGSVVSQAEFNAILWPKLFITFFWCIGIFMLFRGIRKLLIDTATNRKGIETYGYVIDFVDSGMIKNGMIMYDARILIIGENNTFEEYKEYVGDDFYKYPQGSYVRVKHYKKDITILEPVNEDMVPDDFKIYAEENYPNDNYHNWT